MKIYLVGGAVRDLILDRKSSDKDYVVVGSSFEEMFSLGFKSVGKSFPVFIHPKKEGEFALARSEKKSGKKHFDFECFTENVSLEEDLRRRDLTINAIAYDEKSDKFIDPFGGLSDIKCKILRPVSEAFKDDALRILRAARFKTELGEEWKFDKSLSDYVPDMTEELGELSKERIYKETKKALGVKNSSVFFCSLLELGVLEILFPFLYDLTKISHDNEYHKEGSVFVHTMMALDLCSDTNAKWAVLFHDMGKYQSFLDDGNFHRHCDAKILQDIFKKIQKTLSLEREEFEISKFFALNHHKLQNILKNSMRLSKIASLLFKIKDEGRLNSILDASLADLNGRMGRGNELIFSKEQIVHMWQLLKEADYNVNHESMSVEQIKSIIVHKQTNILREFVKTAF
ncbi:MAG: polynucleotide adenylyltransferase [Campylobacteraceae bacterium]|jgi:tRNA nucleotidyltransferase (CCA-adding enzyme)|nr:polynucleotide adenylyltransferase [Campylobacteraceae bacterium]